MKLRFVLILCIFLLVLGTGTRLLAQQETKQETKQEGLPPIRNFLKVNDQFCTGAQPRHRATDTAQASDRDRP